MANHPATHRAWQVTELGDPADVLRLSEVDAPNPATGQVRITVAAAGLNFADTLLCRGEYQVRPPLPFTPGLELAGVVDAVGDGVHDLAIGQRVLAFPALPHGALAQVALAGATDCFALPEAVDDVTAAALGITYQTGWFGLRRRAALQPGETLVVHAGASGVGSAAIQLGKAMGAYVIATAGGPEKVALCTALGADVAIDYRDVDLVEALREATGGEGADVIYDPVGGDVFDASRRCLAFEGRLVVVGFASGRIPDAPANHALVKNYSILGLHWGLYRTHAPALVAEAHAEFVAMAIDGRVKPEIMAVRPLDEVPAALSLLADRGATGKVVIALGPQL